MSLGRVFEELEKLLCMEREALRRLDADAIDDSAARKQELTDQIRGFLDGGGVLPKDQQAGLDRLRELAQQNQILIAHARSCVQGALDRATGTSRAYGPGAKAIAPPPGRASLAPVRLDMRG